MISRSAFLPALLLSMLGCGKSEPTAKPAEAPGASAGPPGEWVYVTNEDSRDLTVIDAATDSVIATIPVGTRPEWLRSRYRWQHR